MRILGIDFGEKRIGVAVSNPELTVALGVTVIERGESLQSDVKKIKEIINSYGDIEEIVVGLPKHLSGNLSKSTKITLEFVEELKKAFKKVCVWDERLSTKAVERALKEINISRKRLKKVVDMSSAVFILQGYLDKKLAYGQSEQKLDK